MPSARTLRLIVAGVGFWGMTWLPVVSRSPHWELVALVDMQRDALGRAARVAELGLSSCFDSIAAAALGREADAVLVVVPPSLHAQLAHEALEHGLDCLIEKPFTTTLDEARQLVERADALDRIIMVSHQYRHRRGARTVAHLIQTEAVGAMGAANVTFANELVSFGYQHELDEPLLWDVAIHHFDLLRGILDLEPTRVQSTSWRPPWSQLPGNASATAVFETADGVTITYTGSLAPRGIVTSWDGAWQILCDDGVIRWHGDKVIVRPLERPLRAKVLRRAFGREWSGRHVSPVRIAEPDRLGVLAEFASAIRDGRDPETSGRDNMKTLALTAAAIESSRRRSTVDVAELR